uniref:PH domain-containing protein n=1 Tax=Callorhinchus milii TaxID=7868 RepID=A0A4W3HCS3_CALMI
MLGNTPLHCAAYRGQKQCALKLLKCGADCNIRNKNNQTALDLAQGTEMKQILDGKPNKGPYKVVQRFEGPLFKRSRFFGLNLHWVVLERGVLSWFQNQSDALADLHRQGCKHLTQAICTVKTTDRSVFSVKYFDDSNHIFKVHPKNEPEQTRQKWLKAIEEHSAYSTHYCSQDQFTDDDDEDLVPVGILQDSFQTVQACQQKLEKEVSALLTMVEDSEVAKGLPFPLLHKVQEVTEASKETSAALSNCLAFFTKQEGVRNLRLEQEQEKTKILSEALQTLACEHHELEQSLVKGSPPQSLLSDDEFYDALSDSDSVDSLSGFETVTSHSAEDEPVNCSNNERSNMSEQANHDSKQLQANGIKKYR